MSRTSSEQWRPIPGYEGLYEVSDQGRVKSAPRPRTRGGLMRQRVGKRGYPVVGLTKDGQHAKHEVHRLVARAFLGPRPDGHEVRHLDGDRTNPSLTNLAYGSRSENMLDKRRHGTDHNATKTHCPQQHPYDESNTYVMPSRPGARYCRTCQRVRSLARYHANKAA